ncbi:inositol monophosphatase (plasmid) [Ensifer adhaerens]|uniref:inositol monophosphatase family protein n=1 Tax=Ensifer adhaerens TaxID=106592 RepID=UPI0023A9A1B8|nr:inositol monophosphatase [Ensifer adhaerens]WDZ80422.1 inositol monophosphatase [Ensifer adhaerens]
MIEAARAGGGVAMRYFTADEPLEMIEKAPRDYQLAADVATERAIAAVLSERFKDAGISGEEGTSERKGTGTARFVIDPIDGTSNFAFRIPFFAQVISYVEDDGIVAGVVYDPVRDEMFVAEKGRGAYLNGKRLPPLGAVDPERSVIGVGLPIPGQVRSVAVERYQEALAKVIETAAVTRRLGSAALAVAYVAAGRHHACFEDSLDILDYLASALMVRECGGVVTDFYGVEQNGNGAVLASVPSLHPWLTDLFAG